MLNSKNAKQFIQEMNNMAQRLKLASTRFKNPHGLSIKRNLSTARDIALLASIALKEPLFREIVKCKAYNAEMRLSNGEIINRA